MADPKNDARLHLCVCACTYRRPAGLAALLDGLAAQSFEAMPRPVIDVVIVDNEGCDEARTVCADFERRTAGSLTYVHEPRKGLSHARNAYLDHVPPGCDFLALIDDDEVPEPDWLEQLLQAQSKTGAEVVRGGIVPVFAEGAPRWIREGDFFGWPRRPAAGRPALIDGQTVTTAGTNNALAAWAIIRELGLRFDPRLNATGGEDSLFFRVIGEAGYRLVYAERALVRESIPSERATLGYLLRVQFRNGNNKILRKLRHKPRDGSRLRPAKVVLKSAGRSVGDVARGCGSVLRSLLTGRFSMDHLSVGMLRMAKGLGGLAGASGLQYGHYASSSAPPNAGPGERASD